MAAGTGRMKLQEEQSLFYTKMLPWLFPLRNMMRENAA